MKNLRCNSLDWPTHSLWFAMRTKPGKKSKNAFQPGATRKSLVTKCEHMLHTRAQIATCCLQSPVLEDFHLKISISNVFLYLLDSQYLSPFINYLFFRQFLESIVKFWSSRRNPKRSQTESNVRGPSPTAGGGGGLDSRVQGADPRSIRLCQYGRQRILGDMWSGSFREIRWAYKNCTY